MLVLSRKKDERIVIGDGEKKVVLMVVEVLPDRVKFGIEAPSEIPVHRKEIWRAIREKT